MSIIFDDKKKEMGRLLLVLDICLTILVFLASFWIRMAIFPLDEADYLSHIVLIPLIITPLGLMLPYFGAYEGLRETALWEYAWAVFRALTISLAFLFTFLFIFHIQTISRLVIIVFGCIDLIVLTGIHAGTVWWYFKKSTQRGENCQKILIIGTGERALCLSRTLRESMEWGVTIIGHLDTDSLRVGSYVLDSPVLGTVKDIDTVLVNNVVDDVMIAVPRTMLDDVNEIARACDEQGVNLRLMADVFDLRLKRMRLTEVGNVPLLTLDIVAQNEAMLLIKRLVDLTLTLLTMPVWLPIMGIVAIAIKLDSPGPVLFIQQRVGLKKRLFQMYKFRSMCDGADSKLSEIEHINEKEGPIFKITNDPRITRVGGFLRKSSLDELPQLFNVLMGQMSLVGPRPMSLRDVNLFDKGIQRKRFSVRPGLTCLWQISGRSNLPFSKWLELDIAYIDNWSFGLDIKILLQTIPSVLLGKGAV